MTNRFTVLIGKFKRPPRLPHYEINTPLTIDECRERLAGRTVDGKWMVSFARPLKLDGWIIKRHISVDLPSGATVRGVFIARSEATRLHLWTSDPLPLHIELLLALPVVIAFGAMILNGVSGFLAAAPCLAAASIIFWWRRRARRSRRAQMTADETVNMIANLIQACAIRDLRNAPAGDEASTGYRPSNHRGAEQPDVRSTGQ